MSDDRSMSADDLQVRMSQLRSELRADVSRTSAAAKQLTDWRYYVRQFPWASAGTVAALGFMLVPRKRERPLVDQDALEKMVAENRVVVLPQKPIVSKKTVVGSIGGLLLAAATRAAMSYVSNQLVGLNRSALNETPVRVRTPK